jgi:hypothetical protein
MLSIKDIVLVLMGVTISVAMSSFFLMEVKKQMPPKVAVVDIVAITTEATDAILKSNGTPEDKAKAATAFTGRLNTEVERLSRDCHCLLLVSAAMVSQPEHDLTGYLKRAIAR